jgi:hypothetical protein
MNYAKHDIGAKSAPQNHSFGDKPDKRPSRFFLAPQSPNNLYVQNGFRKVSEDYLADVSHSRHQTTAVSNDAHGISSFSGHPLSISGTPNNFSFIHGFPTPDQLNFVNLGAENKVGLKT